MATYTKDQLDDLFEKADGFCTYGGKKVHRRKYGERHPQGWEVEHGNPLSRGGADDARNWRVACWACNRLKGNWNASEWRYRLREYYGGECPRWYKGEIVKHHP